MSFHSGILLREGLRGSRIPQEGLRVWGFPQEGLRGSIVLMEWLRVSRVPQEGLRGSIVLMEWLRVSRVPQEGLRGSGVWRVLMEGLKILLMKSKSNLLLKNIRNYSARI